MAFLSKKFSLASRVVVLFLLILTATVILLFAFMQHQEQLVKKYLALEDLHLQRHSFSNLQKATQENFSALQHRIQTFDPMTSSQSASDLAPDLCRSLLALPLPKKQDAFDGFAEEVGVAISIQRQWQKVCDIDQSLPDLSVSVRQMQIDFFELFSLVDARMATRISQHKTDLAAFFEASFRQLLIFTGIGFLVMTSLAFLLLRSLRNSVRELVEFSRNVARGNLDHKLNMSGSQEIADLVSAYNQIAENLSMASEILTAQDKRKDEFVSVASHELRTPIAVLQHALENLKSGVTGQINPEQEQVLKIAESNVNRLGKMIGSLLDMARLESGKLKIKMEKIEIKNIFADLQPGFSELAIKNGKTATFEIDKSVPDVHADADLLAQVITNFFNNALRYATKHIKITAMPHTLHQKPAVRIAVVDDGPGLTLENQKKLFQKFVQIDRKTEASGYRGTGLGLAISKQIVEQHHGVVGVTSQMGVGSEFYFAIPCVQPVS